MQDEELKASNEEPQAINEELHSSAEELETGKEELQSVHEKPTTVNQELKIKIEELNQANNDFQNLINSTDIGTIFLDRKMRIKMFKPSARRIINVIKSDGGRQLSDISTNLDERDLFANIENVITMLQPIGKEILTRDNNWFLMRILPYRTAEDRISCVIITFLDITKRKIAEQSLRRSSQYLRLLMENVSDYAVIITNTDGLIKSWNVGAEQIFGQTEDQELNRPIDIIFTKEDRKNNQPQAERGKALREGRAADERWHQRIDGSKIFLSCVLAPLMDKGKLIGYVKIVSDLTEKFNRKTR